jgi:hypothetical protein
MWVPQNVYVVYDSTNIWAVDTRQAIKVLKSGLNQLISAEAEVTQYDTMVGDGDCGLCLKVGAELRTSWNQTWTAHQGQYMLSS